MRDLAQRGRFQDFFICSLLIVTVVFGVYVYTDLRSADASYTHALSNLSNEKHIVMQTEIEGTKLNIPSYSYFKKAQLWTYINKDSPLSESSTPNLIPVPVMHAEPTESMQIDQLIKTSLEKLVESAKKDGIQLMVSSAYRSAADQQQLYDLYMTTKGQAYTISHVAAPGTSEHQTGRAVDLSTQSQPCVTDSDKCELDFSTIAWLAKNAPKFGFIQRYPMGKQSITGFANEEWHYRYVGIPLAKALSSANMTFDEFVQQVAPGIAKL